MDFPLKKGMRGVVEKISDDSDIVSVHMTDRIKGFFRIDIKFIKKEITKK